eukprot:gnl/TRDRNA2_/TRDRNA2_43527_c0_seq1.p1 gnl/TRDRNA2_/TRDRNA2_43527_c0~~gnl/TRDRNA2_/TRDRNA2_43527_c0_seq1.p1  ORF type:complete len:711 (+),score=201.64 gnl/TRDRNA2_/TRDRNA2_43527_c0_seq1:37-2169(+)
MYVRRFRAGIMYLLSLALAAMAPATAGAGKAALPHFKWGQTKTHIFLSVMVRELEPSSPVVKLVSEGDLHFSAQSKGGQEYVLDLPLREDVNVSSMKYSVLPRPDKWGDATLVTLQKKNEHRWDVLIAGETKKFKAVMDKDWSREDQTLEPEEEIAYAEDHSKYITSLTSKNINKTLAKGGAVVVNVRYPWCSQCKSQDETFAKSAKAAKAKAKKDAAWKKVTFAVIDAREERTLARWLGAKCDYTCEYKVLTEPGEPPVNMKTKFSEDELLKDVAKFTKEAVQVLKSEDELASIKSVNTTCFGGFKSEDSSEYKIFKRVAGQMRGDLVFAAKFGEPKTIELWPNKQDFSFKYDGTMGDNGSAFAEWIRPRAVPLLQEYDWQLRETYEKLGLPMAKVWIDDQEKDNPGFDKTIRHAVRKVAKKFIGKLAFVEQKKSIYSYELRDYGLNQPEQFPSFGIASNSSYNAIKYGFEVTPDIAASNQEMWLNSEKAIEHLSAFCEKALAGTWPEAHETGPVHSNWTAGTVKRMAYKAYDEIRNPATPLLLEVYGKYRPDNEQKLHEIKHLAKVLEKHAASFVVAGYDSSENYVPSEDFKREKYASHTEWYWVPAKGTAASRGPVVKMTKPKKDPATKDVIKFAAKVSGVEINVDEVTAAFDKLMEEDPPPKKPSPPKGGFPGMDGMGDMGGMGGMGGMSGMGGGYGYNRGMGGGY